MHLGEVGHLCCAAAINMPLGGNVKLGDVVGELIHDVPVEAAGLGECIEQQVLIETPHNDDPIESLAVRRKADRAVRAAEEAANLLVKRRRGAPVQEKFGFAGASPEIRGREV